MMRSRAAGITLPDTVVLLVTLALLVAVIVPGLAALRRRSLEGAMRADLRRLAAAEDSYYFDHRVYSGDLAQLEAVGFRPGPAVRIAVHEATLVGWSATVTHAAVPVQCALFVGRAAPIGAARTPGETACR